MAISSILKRLAEALPVILAAAPGVIDAVRQVRQALRKPNKPLEPSPVAAAGGESVRPRQLTADSERPAR